MPKLYSYVMTSDSGFAPNPYHGFMTLACCKPWIRRVAQVGDFVVGTYSVDKSRGGDGHLVFAMRVTEAVTFDEYSTDDRFECKKPSRNDDDIALVGDNIYSRIDSESPWVQADSAHSRPNGSQDQCHTDGDTNPNRVLISCDFLYLGNAGLELPLFEDLDIRKSGPGHRSDFDEETVEAFIEWFGSLEKGIRGDPTNPYRRDRRDCARRPAQPRC